MAARQADPRKTISDAASALGLLVALACATPVIAAQNSPSDCTELADAGLQVSVMKLAAAAVSEHQATDPDPATVSRQPIKTASAAPVLDTAAERISKQGLYDSQLPRSESLPGSAPESNATPNPEFTGKVPDIQTRFPGVSSVELKRFKRQMYRRDI